MPSAYRVSDTPPFYGVRKFRFDPSNALKRAVSHAVGA